MENPAYWTETEHVIDQALKQWQEGHDQGRFGWSRVMCVSNALREAGLLKDADEAQSFTDVITEQMSK